MAVWSTSNTYWNLGNLGDAVYVTYDDMLHKQVTLDSGIYKRFQTPKKGAVRSGQIGDSWRFKVKTGYNESGVGARQADGTIPTSRQATYDEASITERALYCDIKIDLRTVKRANGQGSVLKNILSEAVTDAGEVAAMELARMVYGDGSGIIGTTAAAGSSTTALTLLKTGGFKKSGILYVRKEKIVDGYDGATKKINSIRVTDVAEGAATDSLTLSDAQTWTNGTVLITEDVYHASANTEWEGLGILLDDGTAFASYAGITVSGNSFWKPILDSNSGTNRPFDPEIIEKLLNRQRRVARKGLRNQELLSNVGQPSAYWKYMLPAVQVEATGRPLKFDAGVAVGEAPPFKGIPWTVDLHCPMGEIYILDWNNIYKFEAKPMGPPDIGLGNKGWTWDNSNRTDAAETYRAMYGNFYCTRRNTQIKISDLTEEFWY